MRLYYFLITTLLFCLACSKKVEEPIPASNALLVGKWHLTKSYISAGGPQYWVDVDNGEEIDFFKDGTFTSNRFTDCTKGNFTTDDNELLLNYGCDDFNSQLENKEGFITYTLEFHTTYFTLTPTSGPICIEGCSYKYELRK